jgi:8-oxo-dGTP diphosphatase
MAEPRKHTEVAVGILLREDGAMLLSTRPPGKPYAGYWEFPGGKLEAGETVEQALRRELQEELGITIASACVWKVTEHDYPHALVRLHWCKVREWTGDFEMREGQIDGLAARSPYRGARAARARCRCWAGWPRSAFYHLLLIFDSCWRLLNKRQCHI